MITLCFIKKTVYGKDLFYPDCEATENLAVIAKRKTFDLEALRLLKNTYCFDVKVEVLLDWSEKKYWGSFNLGEGK